MDIEFLNNLREYFNSQGITQREVAEKLGVSPAYINKLFRGEKAFGKKTAQQFQTLFGLSAPWLLTGEGEMLKHAQTITGDGNVQVTGKTLDAALREVENAHNIISKMQQQMDTLLAVIENVKRENKELSSSIVNLQDRLEKYEVVKKIVL